MTASSAASRLSPKAWYLIGIVLVVAGYATTDPELFLWSAPWFIAEIVVLALIWRRREWAWRTFVVVNALLFGALGVVWVGMVFGTGYFMDIQWWGPVCHALALCAFVRFRSVRREQDRRTGTDDVVDADAAREGSDVDRRVPSSSPR